MKSIKYWIYYFKDNDEPYAYTDNKKIAHLFEQDRDMSIFLKIKKLLTQDEVNYLAREYQNSILDKKEISIYDKSRERWFTGSIIMTASEYMSITLAEVQLMESYIYQHCWDNPCVFKDSIYDALELLEYNNVYRVITVPRNISTKDDKINIKPDLLGIFLHYYGKTMKGNKQ